MKRIGEKLKSQRGASILLALLFFLLCAMVGASVLMAAASNAGRSRISREEQQKYLTLSSALQLVCDELTAAEYTAKYDYDYIVTKGTATNPDGTTSEIITQIDHIYTQKTGDYTGKLSQGASCVLPLLEELDWLFAKDFPENRQEDITHWTYNKLSHNKEPVEHTLKLTVPSTGEKTGLNEPVTVTVTLGSGEDKTVAYRIYLKAELGSEANSIYTMYAQLDMVGGASAAPKITEGQSGCNTPITWELSQITREEAK